ncbi:SMI1/KNR4 family protein [Marinimicrobium alkaliphilum]|uniref:SMI1/KNR4 family protein n=1 Tax=Marinimicrobium alkaliphilum TaxID=2202654 RepID=UPI000DBA739F|nr:SMI1/KNR4 family protein [Marinimicrobium alkaliphilum]
MDDMIDLLRERHQAVPVPLELPTHDQLVVVEEELLLPLPRELRTFLLEASDLIIGSLEPVTAADPSSHTYLSDVAARAWDEGMPRHLAPLCETAQGFYAVEPEGEVVYWCSGELTEETWPSVWHWAQEIWLES